MATIHLAAEKNDVTALKRHIAEVSNGLAPGCNPNTGQGAIWCSFCSRTPPLFPPLRAAQGADVNMASAKDSNATPLIMAALGEAPDAVR